MTNPCITFLGKFNGFYFRGFRRFTSAVKVMTLFIMNDTQKITLSVMTRSIMALSTMTISITIQNHGTIKVN